VTTRYKKERENRGTEGNTATVGRQRVKPQMKINRQGGGKEINVCDKEKSKILIR
jgi:hypothetical protein